LLDTNLFQVGHQRCDTGTQLVGNGKISAPIAASVLNDQNRMACILGFLDCGAKAVLWFAIAVYENVVTDVDVMPFDSALDTHTSDR
jgi:hypothetical protein